MKRINWIEGIHYERINPKEHCGMKYRMLVEMVHHGENGLTKTIPEGRKSDGDTSAIDICAEAWFLHDEFCRFPWWDDGTPITNWQASNEYRKILRRYGHWRTRSWIRHYATFLFGGERIKKMNGWLSVREQNTSGAA